MSNYKEFDVDYFFILKECEKSRLDYFHNNIEFKYPIIIDKNNEFFKNNKLPQNKNLWTFLMDENNNVLLVGNPIRNEEIKKLYIKELKKIQ